MIRALILVLAIISLNNSLYAQCCWNQTHTNNNIVYTNQIGYVQYYRPMVVQEVRVAPVYVAQYVVEYKPIYVYGSPVTYYYIYNNVPHFNANPYPWITYKY